MIKLVRIKNECTNSSGIPSKTDYMGTGHSGIYYFGRKPDIPDTLNNYLKKNKNKKKLK